MSDPVTEQTAESAPAFKEISLRELDPRRQRQVEQADKAIEKNPTYAIEICTDILTAQPGCLDVRKILRKAQRKATGGKSKGLTQFLKLTKTPFAMKASSLIKTDPKAALDNAEKLLTQDASNIQALKLVGQAAAVMGMFNTAVFAFDNAREVEPNNIENLLNLGNALIDAGQPKEAVKWGDAVLNLSSNNAAAQDLIRRASVAVTMDKGKWEEGGDFRDKLADKGKTNELEQKAKMANDADSINILLTQLKEKVALDPENITIYRDIISYLKQLKRNEEALEWIKKARLQPLGKGDATLEKLESDMSVAILRATMEALEAEVAQNPNSPRKDELVELKKRELIFRRDQAKNLVEKYPNDYGFRFEYGSLLLDTGEIDLAIRELQLAKRNPKVAHRAMLNLGKAYSIKGIYDLAIEQFAQAKTEMAVMTDLKKEVIYELGQTYRRMGKVDDAIKEFKELYSADIDYKDVSKIINLFYETKKI